MLTTADGPLRVDVLPELGGRIYRIAYDGHDLLRTAPTVDVTRADPFYWSGFVMAPWCNRIPGAVLPTPGGPVSLPPTFCDGSAIHGEVHTRPWHHLDGRPVRLDITGGAFGFPWSYRVTACVACTRNTLTYRLVLQNRDARPMPGGLGWHPWFAADGGTLQIRADPGLCYDQDDQYLAVGAPHPIHRRAYHPRAGGPVPPGTHALYTGLGSNAVKLHWPRRQLTADLRFSAAADHLLLYAPAALDAIAVEPQTHATDGHRRAASGQPGAVTTLEPGDVLSVTYILTIGHSPSPWKES